MSRKRGLEKIISLFQFSEFSLNGIYKTTNVTPKKSLPALLMSEHYCNLLGKYKCSLMKGLE